MGVCIFSTYGSSIEALTQYASFENVYGFDIAATGLTYLGQAVGSLAGLLIILYVYNFIWTKESRLAKEAGISNMAPEKRLIIAKIGAPMFPIS